MYKKTKGQKTINKFLRVFFEKNKSRKVHSHSFQYDLEEYSDIDFSDIFNKYIYGK